MMINDSNESETSVTNRPPSVLFGKAKNELHGHNYELHLLAMLFLRKISKINSFNLWNQVDNVGYFDDIVYEEIDQHGTSCFSCIQVKHKLNDGCSKIKVKDLMSSAEKGEFSLEKYIKSFYDIKENFHLSLLKNLIIFTNTDFDEDAADQVGLKQVQDEIPVLKLCVNVPLSKVRKHYKFETMIKEFRVTFKLWSEMYQLANYLAKVFLRGISLDLNNCLIKKHNLGEQVIDIKWNKVNMKFVLNHGLQPKAKQFRSVFSKIGRRVMKEVQPLSDMPSEYMFWEHIKLQKVKIPSNLEYRNPGVVEFKMSNVDAEIHEFCKLFVFAVNEPNVAELKLIIERLLQERVYTLSLDTFLSSNCIQYVWQWMSCKDSKSCLTSVDQNDLYRKMKSNLDELVIVSGRNKVPSEKKPLQKHALILQDDKKKMKNGIKKMLFENHLEYQVVKTDFF